LLLAFPNKPQLKHTIPPIPVVLTPSSVGGRAVNNKLFHK